jgi:hypothetical protein
LFRSSLRLQAAVDCFIKFGLLGGWPQRRNFGIFVGRNFGRNVALLMWHPACLFDMDKNFTATAGLSSNRYVCSRTLAIHSRQTSGHKVIADTTTPPADNEITVCADAIWNNQVYVLWEFALFSKCPLWFESIKSKLKLPCFGGYNGYNL